MSYPVRRCPYCGHELEDPFVPNVDTAIEKEMQIWRPWDYETMPNTWTDYNGSTGTHEPPMPYKITVT